MVDDHALQEPRTYRISRLAACDATSMIRAGNTYALAKNCYSCHIVADEKLLQAGHKPGHGDFDLIPWMQGEIRHNFHLNQRANAETPTLETLRRGLSLQQRKRVYLIIEQFAKAEVALNHLVALPDDKAMEDDLAGNMIDLFDDAASELEDFFDELEEPEDEDIPGLSEEELAPIQALLDIIEDFDDLDEPTRAAAAEAAAAFLTLHDGSKLKALDEAFLEDQGDPVGKVLAP